MPDETIHHLCSEFDAYTEQKDVITCVGLVKPKQGIFVDEIKYVLVICTTASVILLGLSLSSQAGDTERRSLKLYATDMGVSNKSIGIHVVAGTSAGRIFLGGSDGPLYEMEYSSSESWFSPKM